MFMPHFHITLYTYASQPEVYNSYGNLRDLQLYHLFFTIHY